MNWKLWKTTSSEQAWNRLRWSLLATLMVALLWPGPSSAGTRRQSAGACDVYALDLETPDLAWNFKWTGRCEEGLASGPGLLFEYMKDGGIGDIYSATMSRGRFKGRVLAYGSAFLGTEWRIQSSEAQDSDEDWPYAWQTVDTQVPRYRLPAPLQEALNAFAREVRHRHMPEMPVDVYPARCRPVIEADADQPVPVDVKEFIRSRGGYVAARNAMLEKVLELGVNTALSESQQRVVRSHLRVATAVVGCK